jgi:hypothetical protein
MTELNPIEVRQQEVNDYQNNIDLYTTIASNLPSEWPKHLEHLKGSKNRHEDIASVADLDDVALVGKLWAQESAQAAIRAEMIEKAKAESILEALQA